MNYVNLTISYRGYMIKFMWGSASQKWYHKYAVGSENKESNYYTGSDRDITFPYAYVKE